LTSSSEPQLQQNLADAGFLKPHSEQNSASLTDTFSSVKDVSGVNDWLNRESWLSKSLFSRDKESSKSI
jgi:hypothetical protein